MKKCIFVFTLLVSLFTSYTLAEPTDEEKGGLVWQMWGVPHDWPTAESACEDWSSQFTHLNITGASITNYAKYGSFWYATCIVTTEMGKPKSHGVTIPSAQKRYYLDVPQDDNVLGSCIGNPIDVTTGNKHQVENLFTIESLHPINLNLYFNSSRPEKWRHSYSKSVVRINDLQNVKNGLYPKICGNNQLHESSGGFSNRISHDAWSSTKNFVFAGESHTSPPQTVQYSAESACIANWSTVSNRYHYSWINGSTAVYAGNHRCNILDSRGAKRLTLNIYQTGGHLARETAFECADIDPTVPPGLDSTTPIHARFTREDGSLVSFTYDSIAGVLDNDSQTGERAEFILNGTEITGYRFYSNQDDIEEYDAAGRLLSITSIDGHVQTLSYFTEVTTGQILLDTVENETGESIDFNYELTGETHQFNRIQSISDHTNRTWTFDYASSSDPDTKEGNLKFINNPDGTSRQYHYEDIGNPENLTGITDERKNRYASWTYNSNGKADSSSHGANQDIERVDIVYNESSNSHSIIKKRKSGIGDPVTDINFTYDTHSTSRFKAIAKVTGPDGGVDQIYEHDPETGYLVYKIEYDKRTEYGNHDDNGNPGYIIEAAGTTDERRTDYTYDPRFNSKIATITEPSVYSSANKITTYSYDEYGNKVAINISGYQPNGTSVSRNISLRYEGPFHQLSEINGPRTDVFDVTYLDYYANNLYEGNNRAKLKSVRLYSGQYLRGNIQYTATGKVLSEDRQNGLHIDYAYYVGNDRLQDVTQTDFLSGKSRITHYTYLPTGEVETVTEGYGSADPVKLTLSYDSARRPTRVTDSMGNYIDYVLDTEGNLIAENVYDAAGTLKKALAQTFDNYNRLESTTQMNENKVIDFYPDGTIASIKDGKSVINEYSYDSLKRLVKFTQDKNGSNAQTANASTEYGYDALDNLISVKAANNAETTYVYDDLGNLISRTSPDTSTVSYQHDAAGNIIQSIDAKGQTFIYSYDSNNRLMSIDAPGVEDDTYLVYDTCTQGEGKLCQISRNKSTLDYRYNAFSDVSGIDQSLITWEGYNSANNTIGYDYNAIGRISSIKYPSGATINYTYNSAGKVDNVYMDQDGVIINLSLNISYLPFGKESVQTYGNSINVMGFYDQAYRPFIVGDPAFYFDYISAYDENGNIKNTITLDAPSYENSSFTYDEHQRLISSSGYHGHFNYTYDKAGNKQAQVGNGLETTFAYSVNSNRLTELNSEATNMDENGNITSLRSMAFTYTVDNRLKTTNTGAVYEYNGLGQRSIKHAIAPGVAGSYSYSQSNSFIYGLNGELLAEIGPGGSVKREYVYLNNQLLAMLDRIPSSKEPILNADIDNDGEISVEDFLIWYFNHQTDAAYEVTGDGVAGNDDINTVINCALNQGGCVASGFTTEIYYVHNDHLGTPKVLTNMGGNIVWRATATPFGKASINNDVDGDGAEVEFNIRQPGQYYDRESGLYYNYYRYYDPETGRYITSDPLGVLPGVSPAPNLPKAMSSQYASQTTQEKVKNGINHTYAYVENNPLSSIDQFGLRPTKNPKGPDGRPRSRGCRTICVTNYVGGGLLAAGAGMGFGAIAGSGWVAATTGYAGASANSLYSNFSLAACLDQCNKEEDECK